MKRVLKTALVSTAAVAVLAFALGSGPAFAANETGEPPSTTSTTTDNALPVTIQFERIDMVKAGNSDESVQLDGLQLVGVPEKGNYHLKTEVSISGKSFFRENGISLEKGDTNVDSLISYVTFINGPYDSGTPFTLKVTLLSPSGDQILGEAQKSFTVAKPQFTELFGAVESNGTTLSGSGTNWEKTGLPANKEATVEYTDEIVTNSDYSEDGYQLASELWTVDPKTGTKIEKVDSDAVLQTTGNGSFGGVINFKSDFTIPANVAKTGTEFKVFSSVRRTVDNPKVEIESTERAHFKVEGTAEVVEPSTKPSSDPTKEVSPKPSSSPKASGEPSPTNTEPTVTPTVPKTQPSHDSPKKTFKDPVYVPRFPDRLPDVGTESDGDDLNNERSNTRNVQQVDNSANKQGNVQQKQTSSNNSSTGTGLAHTGAALPLTAALMALIAGAGAVVVGRQKNG